MDTVQSRILLVKDIAAVMEDGLGVAGSKIHLFTAPAVNGPGLILSDFVPASFTGSTAQLLTGHVDGISPSNEGIGKGQPAFTFTRTGGPMDVVLGWYVTDSAEAVLEGYGFFDAPINMAHNGDTILLTFFLQALFHADADVEFIAGP